MATMTPLRKAKEAHTAAVRAGTAKRQPFGLLKTAIKAHRAKRGVGTNAPPVKLGAKKKPSTIKPVAGAIGKMGY